MTLPPLSLFKQEVFLYFLSEITQIAQKYQLKFVFYRLPTRQLSFDLAHFSKNKKSKMDFVPKQNLAKDLVVVFSFKNTLISSWSELRISSSFKAFVFNPLREMFGGERDFFSVSKNTSSFRYLAPNLVWHLDKGNVEILEKVESGKGKSNDSAKVLKDITKDLKEVLKKVNSKGIKKSQDAFFWFKDGGGGDKKKNPLKSTSMANYELAVKKLLSLIEMRKIRKIVLSMVQICQWKKNHNIFVLKSFARALVLYPESMVTLFSSPCLGTWLIASPETLVSISNRHHLASVDNFNEKKLPHHVFCIFSLAGTQPLLQQKEVSEVRWSEKEIEEQAMVSRDVIDVFKMLRLREYIEMGPRTVQSGSLLHLASRFVVDIEKDYGMQLVPDIVPLLHPTSAVVGQPRLEAFKLIDQLEKHDRECYTGYFGPIGLGLQKFCEVELFVNLRSMQHFGNHSIFYAGAGIVRGSVPKKEWEECQFKIKTLQSLFDDHEEGF